MMQRKARCACGAASITVADEPYVHAVCHCGNCKKRTGSAFGINAYFEKAKVVGMEGNTTVYAFHNASRQEDQVAIPSTWKVWSE